MSLTRSIGSSAPAELSSSAPTRYDVDFFDADEQALAEAFLRDGHVIVPVEDRAALDRIRDHVAATAAGALGQPAPNDPDAFLNHIHRHVDGKGLNPVRLAVIQGLNGANWLRVAYYRLVRRTLATLVGNELAMQRRVNLSIQLPNDDSSLLSVHADSWDGDSPFEVVVWVPLVDCHSTKSMYLLPPAGQAEVERDWRRFDGADTEDLFKAIEPHVTYLDVPYGTALVFCQNLMHGNRINAEPETRWSMNCRFKAALSPYADKRLGEFFEPITLRPATRLGLAYKLPESFDE
jgi:sporadic carbohydrate cluster 2OG-Fe(II) oxygenase